MGVKIKPVQRRNPSDDTAPRKYYATAVADGSTELSELAEMIASQSTVSPADCYAVLTALESNVIKELRNGRIVKIGTLGTYRVSISSEGKDTIEEVNASTVKKSKVLYRPGKGIRNMLKNLEFQKSQN